LSGESRNSCLLPELRSDGAAGRAEAGAQKAGAAFLRKADAAADATVDEERIVGVGGSGCGVGEIEGIGLERISGDGFVRLLFLLQGLAGSLEALLEGSGRTACRLGRGCSGGTGLGDSEREFDGLAWDGGIARGWLKPEGVDFDAPGTRSGIGDAEITGFTGVSGNDPVLKGSRNGGAGNGETARGDTAGEVSSGEGMRHQQEEQ
jgi:hypothetical protein